MQANERVLELSMNEGLKTVCSAIVESSVTFRRMGLNSCLVDEDWMRAHSSPVERAELDRYLTAFAVEAVNSESPADILYSDPGQYNWKTQFFLDKVQQRFSSFGPISEICANANTRHLAELTVATQRLSKMLERGSTRDRRAFDERCLMYDQARASELRIPGTDAALTEVFAERPDISRCDQLQLTRCVSFQHGRFDFSISVKIDRNLTGSIFGTMHLENEFQDSKRRVFFHAALPGGFEAYSRFTSEEELGVCVTAWKTFFDVLVDKLSQAGEVCGEVGWKAEI